ncbi:hypothetical protein O181_012994 [Austropuccinia psidii MF-1]|uniref:Uncharacterized protein n=1 Tax=Austropuccinia psidii MF-1 TaxID=1389203 RepID=A0A9Q3BVL3_9BASI|nr:hypothetical protein [Austropuccinia psidii MF-1]
MDLDQDIQVINQKDKNDRPEERNIWRTKELPPVPKGNSGDILVSVQGLVCGRKEAEVGTSSKPLDRDHELLYSSQKLLGPKNTEDLLKVFTPMFCKRQVQRIKVLLKNQINLLEDQKKEFSQENEKTQQELLKPPQTRICLKKCHTREESPKLQSEGQGKDKGKGKV